MLMGAISWIQYVQSGRLTDVIESTPRKMLLASGNNELYVLGQRLTRRGLQRAASIREWVGAALIVSNDQ
jgi:hypothetical protein